MSSSTEIVISYDRKIALLVRFNRILPKPGGVTVDRIQYNLTVQIPALKHGVCELVRVGMVRVP